jgi:hypothetical protein
MYTVADTVITIWLGRPRNLGSVSAKVSESDWAKYR